MYKIKLLRHTLLIGMAFASTLLIAQTAQETASKNFAVSVSKKYCSNATEIINSQKAETVARYMKNESKEIDISTFGTTVHECLHGYDSDIGSDKGYNKETSLWYEGYFIDKGIILTLDRKLYFKTSLLHANYFPEKVKRLNRYDTYVHHPPGKTHWMNKGKSAKDIESDKKWFDLESLSESPASSNVYGIYGLLEEFNAYYHGMSAQYELMKVGVGESKSSIPKEQLEKIRAMGFDPDQFNLNGSYNSDIPSSYYEFNIFMAYYLKYAKEKRPNDYGRIMSNKKLRLIYTLIEWNWRDLLTRLYSDPEMGKRFPCFAGEDEIYSPELQKIMNGFLLPKSDLGTYASFVNSKKYDPTIIQKNRQDCKEDQHFKEEDFDIDSDNTTTITSPEPGFYYVAAKTYTDTWKAVEEHRTKYKQSYPVSGIYLDDDWNNVLYLAKYKSKEKATQIANKYRSKFPKIKVVGR